MALREFNLSQDLGDFSYLGETCLDKTHVSYSWHELTLAGNGPRAGSHKASSKI